MTVLIEIGPRPTPEPEVVFVDDLGKLIDSAKCSCTAGDDNPF